MKTLQLQATHCPNIGEKQYMVSNCANKYSYRQHKTASKRERQRDTCNNGGGEANAS